MLFMYELQAPMTAWQKIGKPEPGIQSHKYGKCLALELFSLNLSAMVVGGGGDVSFISPTPQPVLTPFLPN
jgi:hypothetical protein